MDLLIRTTLAEPLKIVTSYKVSTTSYTKSTATTNPPASGLSATVGTRVYKNYLFGQDASVINDAKQCTIVRGSTLTVESNHGYDIQTAQSDVNILQADLPSGQCFPGGAPATQSFW